MKDIIVDGEPYQYFCATKRLTLHSLKPSQPTIVEKGDYVVLDRHFNTAVFSEAAFEVILNRAFRQFKRTQSGVDGNKAPTTNDSKK